MSAAGACAYLSKVGLCARDYINRDVELENVVVEPESLVEIYKDNSVVFKRNVLIKKGTEFIIYKEPYVE